MKIEILDDARQDLLDGSQFYNRIEAGLGDYFFNSLLSDIDSLQIDGRFKLLAFDVFGIVVDWRSSAIARALRFPFTPLVLASGFGAQSF